MYPAQYQLNRGVKFHRLFAEAPFKQCSMSIC